MYPLLNCRLRSTTSARRMDGCCPLSTKACTTRSLGRVLVSAAGHSKQLLSPVTHRMVEGELFPCLRNFGIRFYAYNPVS